MINGHKMKTLFFPFDPLYFSLPFPDGGVMGPLSLLHHISSSFYTSLGQKEYIQGLAIAFPCWRLGRPREFCLVWWQCVPGAQMMDKKRMECILKIQGCVLKRLCKQAKGKM